MSNHHEVNKDKMRNDIVLTIALTVSIFFVRFLLSITGLDKNDYDTVMFFVFSFICIKITYHLFTKIADKYISYKKNK